MGSEQMTDPCVNGMAESGEWLTAEQFAGMEGMPGTAKGARLTSGKAHCPSSGNPPQTHQWEGVSVPYQRGRDGAEK
ncbi:Uncharacterised protein [Enterobacter asburiae]|uniref:Uncharacterized protein n=1 Tax=Enterobacter asburiae TaxID=61645 RepID=A0A376FE80_ENTAS|nr:Uncharacterised protein [Enterobacter asburiae]